MYYRQKEYMLLLEHKFSTTKIYEARKYKEEYENWIKKFSKGYNATFDTILEKTKEVYGFDLTKVYAFNHVKYYLWRKEFCCEHDEWNEAALSFVCLCCLADLIFDSKRLGENEKKYIADILSSDHFKMSMDSYFKLETKTPIDLLYAMFIKAMRKLREYNPEIFQDIQSDIIKAFESEIYISTNKLIFPDKIDIELITSKSIEFVFCCLCLSAVNACDLMRMKKCARAIAKLFWLVDDMCDLYDDISNSIKNSILFIQKGEIKSLENSIDFVFENINVFFEVIEENIDVIKNNLSDDTYKFFLYELYDWVQVISARMND